MKIAFISYRNFIYLIEAYVKKMYLCGLVMLTGSAGF